MIATVRALTGRSPTAAFGDSADPARPRVRSLAEEVARVVRTRVLNPKWIEAMTRHGYKGAFELAATVDYLFGYDATAHVVEDWMYDRVTDAYVADSDRTEIPGSVQPLGLAGHGRTAAGGRRPGPVVGAVGGLPADAAGGGAGSRRMGGVPMKPLPFSAVVGQQDAKLALMLAAIEPRLGGVLLRGDKGSAKSTLARGIAALLPGGASFVELPLGATEDRVVGSLDLRTALTGGEVRFSPGLLASADGGVLYVDEINLLPGPSCGRAARRGGQRGQPGRAGRGFPEPSQPLLVDRVHEPGGR